MTNLQYISKMLKEGKDISHKTVIEMLINCIEQYDTVEYWAMNYVWLFNETPDIVRKIIEGSDYDVQLSKNPDLYVGGHDAIMPKS